MKTCEPIEQHISTWLDDELDRPGQMELLDHGVRCASCREFYQEARALDGLLASVRTPRTAEAPSRKVWDRIERSASGRSALSGLPAWAWRAAAAVVVAAGLGFLFWLGGPPQPAEEPIDAEVHLGGGEMSEERFIQLTREVLSAEPRYHAAMQQVMDQVLQDTEVREASAEPVVPGLQTEEVVEAGHPSPV